MTRIITDKKGELVNPAILKKREESARKKFRSIESSPRGLQLIEQIDFDLLRTMIKGHADRYNIDPESLNIITKKDIFVIPRSGPTGLYDRHANMIGINLSHVDDLNISERAKQLWALHIIIHEYIHSVSMHRLSDFSKWSKEYKEQRFGLAIAGEKTGRGLMGLEEGFTEIFARKILKEYVQSSGWMTEKEVDELQKQLPEIKAGITKKISRFLEALGFSPIVKKEGFPIAYQQEVAVTESLIKSLENFAGVSYETVFHAFMREKFEGTENMVTDWHNAFIESMGRERGMKFFQAITRFHAKLPETRYELEQLLASEAKTKERPKEKNESSIRR